MEGGQGNLESHLVFLPMVALCYVHCRAAVVPTLSPPFPTEAGYYLSGFISSNRGTGRFAPFARVCLNQKTGTPGWRSALPRVIFLQLETSAFVAHLYMEDFRTLTKGVAGVKSELHTRALFVKDNADLSMVFLVIGSLWGKCIGLRWQRRG